MSLEDRRIVGCVGIALVSTLVAATSVAYGQTSRDADRLAAAEAAFAEGRLEAATDGYEAALAAPGNDPTALHRIHLRLGTLAMMRGRTETAREHLTAALALDPDTPVPPELSPPQQRRFEEVRAEVEPLDLQIEVAEPPRRDSTTRLQLRPSPSLRRLADRLSVRVGDTWRREVPLDGVPSLAMPPTVWGAEARITLLADALDAHGGVLLRRRYELLANEAMEQPTSDPDPDAPADDAEVWESPWFWIVGGLLLGAAGGAIALAVVLGDRSGLVTQVGVRSN